MMKLDVAAFVLLQFAAVFCDELVSIKVVEEPVITSIGGGTGGNVLGVYNQRHSQQSDDLASRATHLPANFSGPLHLKALQGKCFDYFSANYKWSVCPFQNVTQYEQIVRYNAYKGLLGVWYEWEIANEQFTSLVMANGEDCGAHGRRETKIYLECGNTTFVSDITEPSTCHYRVNFKTPLACKHDLMSVYHHLNETLQEAWDLLYTEFHNKIITEKAYNKSLPLIFQNAGYLRTHEDNELLTIKRQKPPIAPLPPQSLAECQRELSRVKEELSKAKP